MTGDETSQMLCRSSMWRGFAKKVEAETMSNTKGELQLNNYHHPYKYLVIHGGANDNDAFPGPRKVCDIWDWNTEEGKARAERLVQCWNSHDQLLEACKVGLSIARWANDVRNAPKQLPVDIAEIEAAIAAGGG